MLYSSWIIWRDGWITEVSHLWSSERFLVEDFQVRMANTSAWKTVSQSFIHKVCDSAANAISFLVIESSTLLTKLCRAVMQDLMAGMHVNSDAKECPEALSVVCIFPPVFPRFKNRRCKTDRSIRLRGCIASAFKNKYHSSDSPGLIWLWRKDQIIYMHFFVERKDQIIYMHFFVERSAYRLSGPFCSKAGKIPSHSNSRV